MNLIEQFICGKKNDPALCEDMIVIAENFVAVIDGATSKSCPVIAGLSGGRFAAETAARVVQGLAPDAAGQDVMRQMTAALRSATSAYMDITKSAEKPACSVAIYSRARREIWRVGDIGILVDGAEHVAPKAVDDIASQARAAMIRGLLLEGETLQSLQADDKGRAFIFPLLQRQHLFANRPGLGAFGYGVMNGDDIPEEYIEIIPAADAHEIVLASDGYPVLRMTHTDSEQALQDILRDDPLLYKIYPATKGMQAGQVSFDDRSYVRFSVS